MDTWHRLWAATISSICSFMVGLLRVGRLKVGLNPVGGLGEGPFIDTICSVIVSGEEASYGHAQFVLRFHVLLKDVKDFLWQVAREGHRPIVVRGFEGLPTFC